MGCYLLDERERDKAEQKPARDPDARDGAVKLQEENRRKHDQEDEGPAAGDAEDLSDRLPERRRMIGLQALEGEK